VDRLRCRGTPARYSQQPIRQAIGGQPEYLIAKQAATGFPGLGNLNAEAMGEANQYCAGKGREFLLLGGTETEPPCVLGN
jgi:hypothetical protein